MLTVSSDSDKTLSTVSLLSILVLVGTFCFALYQLFFHPLSKVPGPRIASLTSLWHTYHSFIGDEWALLRRLHQKYGTIVRIGPNEVDISDGSALGPVYVEKGGFLKAPMYDNFHVDGFHTIATTTNPEFRAIRAKPVASLFSQSAIRKGSDEINESIDRFVQRLQELKDASDHSPVDLQEPARVLGFDLLASYLFRDGGNSAPLHNVNSANAVITWMDSYLDAGRLFWFSNDLYNIFIERLGKWRSKAKTLGASPAEAVHEYLLNLPSDGNEEGETYQGRLRSFGVPREQIAAECKDLLFAGIHSFGAILATTLWHLIKNPSIYQRLRAEILTHRRTNLEALADPSHSIPYLSFVVKEGLRLAPVNSRLPRIVPRSGWTFHSHPLPGGTIVSISAPQLHFNPSIFHAPMEFQPERWAEPSAEMVRDFVPFSVGSRQCVAKNLAVEELGMAILRVVEGDVLGGARANGEKIVFWEWFNTAVRGRVDVSWPEEGK